jgi:hypothetical protein
MLPWVRIVHMMVSNTNLCIQNYLERGRHFLLCEYQLTPVRAFLDWNQFLPRHVHRTVPRLHVRQTDRLSVNRRSQKERFNLRRGLHTMSMR